MIFMVSINEFVFNILLHFSSYCTTFSLIFWWTFWYISIISCFDQLFFQEKLNVVQCDRSTFDWLCSSNLGWELYYVIDRLSIDCVFLTLGKLCCVIEVGWIRHRSNVFLLAWLRITLCDWNVIDRTYSLVF